MQPPAAAGGALRIEPAGRFARAREVASAVAALEGIATPSLVAKAVMDVTDHILLVGEGAKRFALALGFEEPRIAVCGLNPHAGEDGQFGDEEKRIIARPTPGNVDPTARDIDNLRALDGDLDEDDEPHREGVG